MEEVTFRYAAKKDIPLILEFIRLLAEYEKVPEQVTATEELLKEWLFEKKQAEVIFAVVEEKEIGFALFFQSFATYPGKGGLYVDDLYIRQEYRGRGYGKAMFRQLARIAQERGGVRIEWLCLNWNPSIEFYRSIGGKELRTCTTFRLEGEKFNDMADSFF